MENPNRFYTYAYLREDRTPYYIGKGSGNRLYKRNKCELNPPKDLSRIIFLKQNLIEEEAFKHEIYMIAVFGRKDLGTGILRNKTDGGEGGSGATRSEEYRDKMSKAKSGENNPNFGKTHSQETRDKLSKALSGENHPFYGKTLSQEHRDKLSKSHRGKTLSQEIRDKMSKAKSGTKWWNDGKGNTKFCVECPDNGWVLGRK